MQFIVFAAFAIALSIPDAGPPWPTVESPIWTAVIVAAYLLTVGIISAFYSRLVKIKLEREPTWLPSAQERMSQANGILRMVLLGGLAVSAYLTDFSVFVRSVSWIRAVWGLDELLIMSPFLVSMILSWIVLYPADRAIREVALELRLWASEPSRPVWHLWTYLVFMLRHQVLIIFVPMVPIVMANDAVSIEQYGRQIREATGVPWADQAVVVCVAGLIFLVAPVLLRYIWHTRRLPDSDLRQRLESLCRRVGLTYREILIWESDGMVVNAAVMGMFKPVRYILLSDGLLETMEDRNIEAVFGHEAGHVKLRHIEYYMLFAIVSMLIVGGITELAWYLRPESQENWMLMQDYLQVTAMILIVAVWGIGFGFVSRRFEWQADLFGAESVTPSAEGCTQPCIVHGTATEGQVRAAQANHGRKKPICASAANLFGESLHRIAVLNGIPPEANSWRHSSIGNRIRRLKRYASDPSYSAALERNVNGVKVFLFAGTLIGCVIAAWLYWPWR
jgi:Zn-dependent protease with chaperone function